MRTAIRLLIPLTALGIVFAYAMWTRARVERGFGVTSVERVALPDAGEVRWLKGQLHLHSSMSGDSETAPEQVARWYARHGYDFIVFTDHNHITALPPVDGMLVIPGVEITQNLKACVPAPLPGMQCLIHVNALFVDPSRGVELAEPKSQSRADLYGRAIDAALAMGGLAQVNHPNFHYGAGLDELVAASRRGALLVEVANQAVDSNNEGDDAHPSTEALWAQALDAGARLYGVATDDAHHYEDAEAVTAQGKQAYVGDRGFVMVHAAKSPEAIRAALERGDFYASTGPLLSDVQPDAGGWQVERLGERAIITGPTGRAWTQPRW